MSDDLVKRARDCANGLGCTKTERGDLGIFDDLADRIEELKKACDEEEIRSVGWAEVSQSNYQRAEAAEAKLAWAVGELQEMLMLKNSEAAYGILRVYTKALLAELKGQDDV